MAMLKKNDILRGLRKIDAKAKEAGVIIDLSIYGAMSMQSCMAHRTFCAAPR